MAHQRTVEFEPQSLLELLKHYAAEADDSIPMDAELVHAGIHPHMHRWIGLWARGKWSAELPLGPDGRAKPLHVRYEGQRTMSWGGKADAEITWDKTEEVKLT
jgi:hypothetical protein